MKKLQCIYAIVAYLGLSATLCAAQEPDNCHHIDNNSFSCQWKITANTGSLKGEVISFTRQQGRCGDEFVAAVAILKTATDTVRAILECYRYILEPGEIITVKIYREPFCGIGVPQDIAYALATRKQGKLIYRVNEWDEVVKKTIFGGVIDIQPPAATNNHRIPQARTPLNSRETINQNR
jgi:hypothetical protein